MCANATFPRSRLGTGGARPKGIGKGFSERRRRKVSMGLITGIVLLLAAVLLAIGVFLVGRYAVRIWRHPQRAWVERCGGDRRRRDLPVTFDRRTGPRRQEDIARLFLAGMSS
jgi:hypothetical protein